jgi:hypothetical protein
MQVVIYDQLVTDNVVLNDGDESKGGVVYDLSLEAEPSEENRTSSSANKQLSFK